MKESINTNKAYLTKKVEAFRNGDESAFGDVYHLIADKLLRYAMVMTKDHMEAEDLLQDTMVEIVKSIGKLRDSSAFTSWSVQIMRNLYSHKMRKTSEVVARDDSDLEIFENIIDEDMSYRPDLVIEDAGVRDVVNSEMDRLPEAQRTAMVAYYYDDMSVKEISEMMGATENTTKSRLFAGRKAMKQGIEKYEKSTGVRIHEFAPASLIVAFMRTIFEGAGVVESDVLINIFRKVVEETGISASLPSDPWRMDAPESEAETTADESADATEQETGPPEETTESSGEEPEVPEEESEVPEEEPELPDEETEVPEEESEVPEEEPELPDEEMEVSENEPELPEETPDETSLNENRNDIQNSHEQPTRPSEPSTADTSTAPRVESTSAPTEKSEPMPEPKGEPIHEPVSKNPNRSVKKQESIAKEAQRQERAKEVQRQERAKKNESRARRSASAAEIRKKAERSERKTKLNRRALLLRIIGAFFGVFVIMGVSFKYVFPDLVNSIFNNNPMFSMEDNTDAYAKAYISTLHLNEEHIREYTWQWQGYISDEPVSTDIRPIALKDIDGDEIPELFFMSASINDAVSYIHCADLHILTFKNGKLQELKYEYEYPNEYTPGYYEQRLGQHYVNHDGRMLNFNAMDPNDSYAVFTGKTAGTFYILSYNATSEAGGYRIVKYSMENVGDTSKIAIVSDTYSILTGEGYFESANPNEELQAAIDDMSEMLLFGGYGGGLGYPPVENINALPNAEEYGWREIQYMGNDSKPEGADIAPEIFQRGLLMSFDGAVAALKELIIEPIDDTEIISADYISIKNDGKTYQLGNTLLVYDEEEDTLKEIQVGDTEYKRHELGAFGSYNQNYHTNGNSMLYLDYSEYDTMGASYSVPLVKYNMNDGEKKILYEFEGSSDPNAAYHLGAVHDGNAYITFSSGDGLKMWSCDLDDGEVTALEEQGYIRAKSGSYVLTTSRHSLSALDVAPGDIYELENGEMKHIAKLGDNITAAVDVINDKFYYSESINNDNQDVTIYRCNADGTEKEKLANFLGNYGYNVSVERYTENYCMLRVGPDLYRFEYETEEMLFTR